MINTRRGAATKTTDSDSDSGEIFKSESSPEPKSKKMSEKVSLSVLTKFIKSYSGDRESLPAFLTNCDNAILLANSDQQDVLCKYILSQLEGKAQVACSLKKFNNWQEIKSFLKSSFGEKKHSTHLLVDLQSCKQMPSEDVVQYSLRLEACLTRLQSDVHSSCTKEEELIGRVAAMESLALNTFLLGLNPSFSHIVRCRNPQNLSDAINCAVEEEKLHNLTKINQRQLKHCNFCNKNNHLTSECFKNKNKSSNKFQHVNYNSSLPNNNPNFNTNNKTSSSNYNSNKSCAYCRKKFHTISECHKLRYKNDNMQRNSNPLHAPSTSQAAFTPNSNNSTIHNIEVESCDVNQNNLN